MGRGFCRRVWCLKKEEDLGRWILSEIIERERGRLLSKFKIFASEANFLFRVL